MKRSAIDNDSSLHPSLSLLKGTECVWITASSQRLPRRHIYVFLIDQPSGRLTNVLEHNCTNSRPHT